MHLDTNLLTYKTLGARIPVELHEQIKYTAIKNNISQGELLAEMFKSYKHKATAEELEMLKEQEHEEQIVRKQARLAQAEQKLIATKRQEFNKKLAKLRESSSAQRREATQLEAESLIERLSQELEELASSYKASPDATEEVQ